MSKNGLGMPPVQVTILELKGLIRTNLLKNMNYYEPKIKKKKKAMVLFPHFPINKKYLYNILIILNYF